MKSGIKLISEIEGEGDEVQRGKTYLMRLQFRLNKGDSVIWKTPCGFIDRAELLDSGKVLTADIRVDRESMLNGLFYGIQGMKIGGTRKIKIPPHLAYEQSGIDGVIPESAVLLAEITIIEERKFAQ